MRHTTTRLVMTVVAALLVIALGAWALVRGGAQQPTPSASELAQDNGNAR